jgi:hypothetical protein
VLSEHFWFASSGLDAELSFVRSRTLREVLYDKRFLLAYFVRANAEYSQYGAFLEDMPKGNYIVQFRNG